MVARLLAMLLTTALLFPSMSTQAAPLDQANTATLTIIAGQAQVQPPGAAASRRPAMGDGGGGRAGTDGARQPGGADVLRRQHGDARSGDGDLAGPGGSERQSGRPV